MGTLCVIFFIPVTCFGTLFLMNLILAIVEDAYVSEAHGEREVGGFDMEEKI